MVQKKKTKNKKKKNRLFSDGIANVEEQANGFQENQSQDYCKENSTSQQDLEDDNDKEQSKKEEVEIIDEIFEISTEVIKENQKPPFSDSQNENDSQKSEIDNVEINSQNENKNTGIKQQQTGIQNHKNNSEIQDIKNIKSNFNDNDNIKEDSKIGNYVIKKEEETTYCNQKQQVKNQKNKFYSNQPIVVEQHNINNRRKRNNSQDNNQSCNKNTENNNQYQKQQNNDFYAKKNDKQKKVQHEYKQEPIKQQQKYCQNNDKNISADGSEFQKQEQKQSRENNEKQSIYQKQQSSNFEQQQQTSNFEQKQTLNKNNENQINKDNETSTIFENVSSSTHKLSSSSSSSEDLISSEQISGSYNSDLDSSSYHSSSSISSKSVSTQKVQYQEKKPEKIVQNTHNNQTQAEQLQNSQTTPQLQQQGQDKIQKINNNYIKKQSSQDVKKDDTDKNINLNDNQQQQQLYKLKTSNLTRHQQVIQDQQKSLPAYQKKQEFIDLYNQQNIDIIIVKGETGSGKSTQIPQFILQSNLKNGINEKIVVTQPRTIAAIGLGERVADEYYTEIGNLVGYQTRFQSQFCHKTLLKYVTEGILIREICSQQLYIKAKQQNGSEDDDSDNNNDQQQQNINNNNQQEKIDQKYKTIIIDEVHERNLNTDILLGLVKIILSNQKKNLKKMTQKQQKNRFKLIIMSATVDTNILMDYFSQFKTKLFEISGTLYPVQIIYDQYETQLQKEVEEFRFQQFKIAQNIHKDFQKSNKYRSNKDKIMFSREYLIEFGLKQINYNERNRNLRNELQVNQRKQKHNHDQIVQKVSQKAIEIHNSKQQGDILIFMTGEEEINGVYQILNEEFNDKIYQMNNPAKLLQVYGNLTPKEQSLIFEQFYSERNPKMRKRKIIIATNIAETSITIDGIVFVIDSGYNKQITYDPVIKRESLLIQSISQASADQRKGRAGRTQSGKCYRMYTEENYLEFKKFSQPEIQRSNLSSVVLYLLQIGINKLEQFPFLDKPSDHSIKAALQELEEINAIKYQNKTNLPVILKQGIRMAQFPLDPKLSATVLRSIQNNCFPEVLSIISILTTNGNLWWKNNYGQDQKSIKNNNNNIKNKFENVVQDFPWINSPFLRAEGDLIMLYHIFSEFFNQNGFGQQKTFCENYNLNFKFLKQALSVYNQILNLQVIKEYDLSQKYPEVCEKLTSDTLFGIQKSFLYGFSSQIALNIRQKDYKIYPSGSDIFFNRNSIYKQFIKTNNSTKIHHRPSIILYIDCLQTEHKMTIKNCLEINQYILNDFSQTKFPKNVLQNPKQFFQDQEDQVHQLEQQFPTLQQENVKKAENNNQEVRRNRGRNQKELQQGFLLNDTHQKNNLQQQQFQISERQWVQIEKIYDELLQDKQLQIRLNKEERKKQNQDNNDYDYDELNKADTWDNYQ